ncbi:peptidase [Aureococcus anophagefferens]|nr:peptidase [Aureococcus anophagefferens]
MRAAIVTIALATSARAFVAPAPKTSALRAPRTGVEQHLGPTDVLAALPSVPALPAGTGAVAGELGVYALKTAISWGVPAAVVALVAEGTYLAERADARAEAALYRAQLRGKAPAAVGEQSNATKNSTGNVLRRLAKNPFGKNGDRQAALEKVEDATRRELEAELDYLDAASQLANLREEVTAVLGFANATRGDEVVLKLNSGGGTVTGYGLAAAQLMRVKDAGFKLTVCIEQVAASGGYMMACVGDRIVASPFAVLGSIGVISDIPNVYERLKKEGIEFQTVTAGAYKRTLTPTKKVTKEDMDNGRPLDIDAVATGETWFGEDALKRRLCDELRTFDDVCLDYYHQGTDVLKVTYAKPPATPLAALLQTADAPAGPSAAAAVAQLAKAALRLLADLAAAADAGDANLRRPMALDDDLINRFKAQDLL